MMYKVVLTRADNDIDKLTLEYPAVEWLDFPLIEFEHLKLEANLLQKIEESHDWLIFSSQNAVKSFFDLNPKICIKNIACVGPKTRSKVESYGFKVNFIPSNFTSLSLAIELPCTNSEALYYIGGNLLYKSSIEVFKAKCNDFNSVICYHTNYKFHSKKEWESLFNKNPEIISFTSPSAVRSCLTQIKNLGIFIPENIKYAAIGTTTEKSIKDDMSKDSIVSKKHTFAGMIDIIVETLRNDSKT